MAKIKDLSNNKIIEVKDKARVEKLLGYPDKFQLIEEIKTIREEKKTRIDKEK